MTPEAYNLGKEHANYGLCNPTYWTLGSLLTFLRRLEKEAGLTREKLAEDYLFLTPAACGPCRYGMYESEYRMALRGAGHPDFRVIPFYQVTSELNHDNDRIELHSDIDFIFAFVNGAIVGDPYLTARALAGLSSGSASRQCMMTRSTAGSIPSTSSEGLVGGAEEECRSRSAATVVASCARLPVKSS